MRTPRLWLAVLGLVSTLGVVYPAAFPSETETIVVARSDDDVTTPTSTTEVATEEPLPPIKLTQMEVTSNVSLRYAHTTVVAHVKNPAKKAQEAHFRVLLPETAFISGFVMTINGKSYKAYVKEKEEAKQIYQDAVSQGISAAHVSAKARDSNHFTVTVNIESSSYSVFNLTYEEMLVRHNGVYNHAINMHPGALVPKLTVTVHISESEKITELRVPEIRTGNEIDATKDDPQNTKAVIERGHDDREATITFTPDLEEQMRLMQIYAEKSKESASHTNALSLDNDNKAEGIFGQFVVQYDVDRSNDGIVLVNDGYFVHFFAPTDLPVLNKYVIFVLDTSGSMMGRKIEQLREAMMTILSDLNAGDYFNIVEFASSVTVHDLKEAEQEPPKHTYYFYEDNSKPTILVAPSQATPENIDKAKVIVSRLDAVGGTNIGAALDVAVSLNNKRFKQSKEEKTNSTSTTLTPDVTPTTESTTTTEVVTQSSKAFEDVKALEPIIIFLTDGDPTVGETNPSRIITHLSEKNFGPQKATIFSLAFGEDADRKILRKISLRNDGFMRHIYEAADAPLQLRDFYRQVSSPVLANVKFSYPVDQVKSSTVTKDEFRAYYSGSEMVVAGQLAESATELTPRLSGFCGVIDADDGNSRKKYEKSTKVPIPTKKQGYLPLERLWAYLSIKQLLDEKDAADESEVPKDKETPEKKALNLALKYEFVTPLTSLVVVKPNMTSAVNAESVDNKNYDYEGNLASGLGGFAPLSFASYQSAGGLSPGSPYASSAGFGRPMLASAHAYPISALLLPTLEADSIAFEETEVLSEDFDDIRGSSQLKSSFTTLHSYPPSGQIYSGIQRWGSPPASASYDFGKIAGGAFWGAPTHSIAPFILQEPVATTTVPVALGSYHLEKFNWADSLLNTSIDALVLQLNETVTLKLTKDTDAPKPSTGDAECTNAIHGGVGLCVYLTRCEAAQNITVDEYKSDYCLVDQGYAGVCCPKSDVDLIKT